MSCWYLEKCLDFLQELFGLNYYYFRILSWKSLDRRLTVTFSRAFSAQLVDDSITSMSDKFYLKSVCSVTRVSEN